MAIDSISSLFSGSMGARLDQVKGALGVENMEEVTQKLTSLRDVGGKVGSDFARQLGEAAGVQKIQSSNLDSIYSNSKLKGIGSAPSIGKVFSEGLSYVNEKATVAEGKVGQLMGGGDVDIHDVMISLQERKLAFNMMVEFRNHLVEGWNQLTRMQT